MELKLFETEKFIKLPDMSGASYDDIEEFKPKSNIKVENFIRAFLDYSDAEKIQKNPPISACMLVAPWGLGKTTTYDLIILNLLKEKEYDGYSVKLRAQDISNYYDNFKETKKFKNIPRNADRFLFLISRLLLESVDLKSSFPQIKTDDPEIVSIEDILYRIKEDFNFFLIFIDELEEVVRNKNDIIPFILKSIKDLLNGSSNIINNKSNPELIHFLSFILACTDAAIYEISRLEQLEYQYGGIKRRIHEERIPEISFEESIEYLAKLNRYSYDGKFINSFVNPGASFSTIAKMAMKNPGYMKTYYTYLMNRMGSFSTGNLMYQIDGKFILENSENLKLEYMETQRRAINNEVYNNWFKKFKHNELILNILYLFIGEIKPFSVEELKNRFDEEISKNEILKSISIFNEYIGSIHSNIKEAIIPVNLLEKGLTKADIQNLIKDCGFPIEESEDFTYNINFREEGHVLFEDFIESISYYEIDKNGIVKTNFFFSLDRGVLKQLFPFLNTPTIMVLMNQFNKKLIESNDYFILNPFLYNIIFPLPIPQEYNLLDDKNETVRLWTDISRKRKGEIFKNQICKILSDFLITKNIISRTSMKEFNSEIKQINDIKYFEDVLDKKKLIILKNYHIKELSDYPINLLLWRELGDYTDVTINEITERISSLQINDLINTNILILFSQSKIPENLIVSLSKTLEYSIIKELPLSQFDITKYAFLSEINKKYQGAYDEEKFDLALKQLLSPFEEIIKDSIEDIENLGLSIKLNHYISNLSNIPQLIKYVLYDFKNDFSNYSSIELQKPFDNINPIGLSPRYSSSIDDWSDERLRTSIADFLLTNGFVKIEDNSLKITMPKIENNILKLVKMFDNENKELSLSDIRLFFFDKSGNPSLLKDVFLTDLENRGLIKISKDSISLNKIKKSELKEKFTSLKLKLKKLRINDRNFYHIFTMKLKGFSLIFLNDFLNELEILLKEESSKEFNEYISETKKNLFDRIYKVFNGVIDKIFFPMDKEIHNFRNNLVNKIDEKFEFSFINKKLNDFGLGEIDIQNFPKIKKLYSKLSNIIRKTLEPVNRDELYEKAKKYHKINKTNVKVAGEDFSYHRLQENKLKKEFKSPYLNLIYNDMKIERDQYLESKLFQDINTIKSLIKKIDNSNLEIKGQISKVSFDGSTILAPKIFDKIKTLSGFEFKKPVKNIEEINQVIVALNELNKSINKLIVPISQILKRKGRRKPKSLLDKIHYAEKSIQSLKKNIKNNIDYLKEKKIITDEVDTKKFYISPKNLDFSDINSQIENCKDLAEFSELSLEIYNQLQSENDSLNYTLRNISDYALNFFKSYKDIPSLEKLFRSLRMDGYAKVCKNYLNQLRRFSLNDQDIPLKNICSDILSLKKRIEKGYEEGLKKQLDEKTQKIFLELSEKYGNKKWFTESELNNVINKYNLNQEKVSNLLEELSKKDLIEKRYHFK